MTLDLIVINDKHYYCYLIRSLSTRRTYVGVTNNLKRRLRQHNGIIANGAKATRRGRPWQLVAYVSGFLSKIEALKFEWQMHHPRIKWRGLDGRIKVLIKILKQHNWWLYPNLMNRVMKIHFSDQNSLFLMKGVRLSRNIYLYKS